jgi:hypothetical protein
MTPEEIFQEKTRRNFRVSTRLDELYREGKHGHYENIYRVVREEVEAAIASAYEDAARICEDEARLRDNQAAATANVESRNLIVASHNTAWELANAIRARAKAG